MSARFDIRQAGKPLLAFFAFWLVLAVACHILLVRPKIQEYRSLDETTSPERQALLEREHEVERFEQYLGGLQNAERDLQTLRNEVLSTRDARLVEVQLEVEDLCRDFSIDWESVTHSNAILPDEELDKLILVVPLEGGYTNLRKFLQAVESSEKFLLVEKVALAEGKDGGVMLQLNITMSTYFDLPESMKKQLADRKRRPRRRA
ncbi:MAG: hypothetical protein GY716_09445 [bacterium]|nr:hypothetical protein [bacterium]